MKTIYIMLFYCAVMVSYTAEPRYKCHVDLISESYPAETVTIEKNTIYLFCKIVVL